MEFHIDRRYAFLCCTFFLLLRNPDRTNAQTFGLQSCEYQENGRTIYSACVPEPFNILFPGRSSYNLTITPADSTCGLTTNFQSYCLIYSPVGGDRCLTCDSTDDNNKHPREYMVDVDADGDGNMQTWWQSKSWYDYPTPLQVSIELAFDKQYELTDNLVITFESARPKSMNLELSRDFGQTWQIVQYYDMNCNSSLLGLDAITATNPTAVVCVSSDSQLTPYTNGLVTFGVLNDRYAMYLGANYGNYSALYNAFSNTNLNSFLTFTNIRINLLEPNNLGLGAGAQSTVQSTLQEASAYYAISNIKITASCSCNLHGKFCQMDPTKGRTVCVCQHNTMGDNCEMCKPLYNKRPWMPGLYLPTGRIPSGTANECQKCECNDHAESCVFNTALGRPICINCMHNTAGEKCDSCINAYFENTTLPLNSPDICIPCDCEPLGVMNNQLLCDQTLGTCTCKPGVVGRKCDECQPGFYGLLLADENPGECKQCGCNTAGTYDLVNKCDKTSGDCTCKPNIEGAKCDSCKDGFYQYPSNTVLIVADCLSCDCDTGGAVNNVCDKGNGQCNCRIGMTGRKCDQVIGGSFSPYIDYYSYQVSSGTCGLSTDLITDSNPFTGRTFMVCAQNQEVVFDTVSNLNTGSLQYAFKPVLRYSLNGSLPWQEMTLRATTMGNSEKDLSKYAQTPGQNIPAACPESAGGIKVFQIQNLTAGVGLAWTAENMTMDVRCKYQFNLLVGNPGLAGSEARLYVDSVVLSPDVKQTGIYGRADPSTQLEYEQCFFNFLQLSTRSSALVPPVCSSLMSSVGVEMEGQAPDCQCNQIGTMDSVNLQCNSLGGQCSCKPGVFGRSCDVCMPGYYEFSYLGCKPCNCNPLGSTGLVCDVNTGQCPCQHNVALGGENSTLGTPADLTCSFCKRDFYGVKFGTGCEPCLCKATQSSSSQCDSDGRCTCVPSVGGDKCTECLPGFFGYSDTGCTNCNCSLIGANNPVCDVATGQCSCKANVLGLRCDQCKADSFNLNPGNPQGCQKCFCYGHSTACVSAPGYTSDVISSPSVYNWTTAGEIVTMSDESLFYNDISLANGMYRQAPGQYLGYHQDSYGLLLSMDMYNIANANIPLQGTRPVVIIGNGKGMYYETTNTTVHSMRQTINMRLHHDYWKATIGANQPTTNLSLFNMNAILSDIQGIYIRTVYNNLPVEVENVRLEGAKPITDKATQPAISSVESCACDPARNTQGNSCQNCAQGFKRSMGQSDPYDACQACNCGGRGETTPPICNEVSGECLNCRNGTTGFNCESCDANVEGVDCDTCVTGFYGIQKGGCLACNCDPTGTKPSTVCQASDGQCDCQPFVNSRQCDQCVDNYHDLQITGCKECDQCYKLVETEVNLLREMQANMTNYINQLEANDNNTVLGPFHQRLDATQASMTTLIAFLSESMRVGPNVSSQIARLNTVLNSLNEILAVDIDADLTNATKNLNSTHFKIEESESLLTVTKEHVVKTQLFIHNILDNITAEIDTLLQSIKSTETLISQISGGALADANRVLNQVKTIERDVDLALTTAQNTVTISQQAESKHMDNTKKIGEEDTRLTSLTTTKDTLTTNANKLNADAQQLETDNVAMLTETNSIQPVVIDAQTMIQKADQTAISANSLRTRANETYIDNQGVPLTVQRAKIGADTITNQAVLLQAKSEDLVTRMDAAYQAAMDGRTSEQKTFTDAVQMLDIMQNFGVRVATVEQAANQSLTAVQQLQTDSQTVEIEARTLQTDLAPALQLAKDALDLSTASLQAIQNEDSAIRPVRSKAMDIQMYTDPLLNNVATTVIRVSDLNRTDVQPADITCEGLESQIENVNKAADEAVTISNTATENVVGTREKLDKLLLDINNIRQLDPTKIQELRDEVANTRTRFTAMELGNMVLMLKQASEEQRKQINEKSAKRDDLRNKVRRLQNIADQFNLPGG